MKKVEKTCRFCGEKFITWESGRIICYKVGCWSEVIRLGLKEEGRMYRGVKDDRRFLYER